MLRYSNCAKWRFEIGEDGEKNYLTVAKRPEGTIVYCWNGTLQIFAGQYRDGSAYEVDLDIRDETDWLFHLAEKQWVTVDAIYAIADAARRSLRMQGYNCPECFFKWSKSHADEAVRRMETEEERLSGIVKEVKAA